MNDQSNNVVRLVPRPAPPDKAPPLQFDDALLDPQTGDLTLYLRDADGNSIVMKYDLRDWSGPKGFELSTFVEFWQGWCGSTGVAS